MVDWDLDELVKAAFKRADEQKKNLERESAKSRANVNAIDSDGLFSVAVVDYEFATI